LTPHQVVLVEPASIEKTSSGKIARALCRAAWLQGRLRAVATWTEDEAAPVQVAAAPRVDAAPAVDPKEALRREIQRRITAVAGEFLKRDVAAVPVDKAWAELGFDSVNALQLAMRVQKATGVALDATVLWDCANIAELAAHIAGMSGAAEAVGCAVPPAMAESPAAVQAPDRPAAATPSPTEAGLASLSDADAEALLLKELER
jgi:acyl carrier protein